MKILVEDGAFPSYRGLLEACGQEVAVIGKVYPQAIDDVDWLPRAIADRYELVITSDKQIRGRQSEKVLLFDFFDSGGKVLFLGKSFRKLEGTERLRRLKQRLDHICTRVQSMPEGHFTTLYATSDGELALNKPRTYSSAGP